MDNLSLGLKSGLQNKNFVKNNPNKILKTLEQLAMADYNDYIKYKTEDLSDDLPYKDPFLLYSIFESMLSNEEKDYIDNMSHDRNEPFDFENDIYDYYYTGGKPLSINDLFAQLNSYMEDDMSRGYEPDLREDDEIEEDNYDYIYDNVDDLLDAYYSQQDEDEKDQIDEWLHRRGDNYDFIDDIYESYMHGDKMSLNDLYNHYNSAIENDMQDPYYQYLNHKSNVSRDQFLDDYKDRKNEEFYDFMLRKYNYKPTLDDFIREENSFMTSFIENPKKSLNDNTEWWR